MPYNLQTYKVANLEPSSSTKQDNMVQAIENNLNDLGTLVGALGAGVFGSATPPPSPNDGDLWILPVNALGVRWQFRYNAGSASAYKWEFVGGAPLRADVATAETTTSAGAVNLATPQNITIPRAGDYDIYAQSVAGSTNPTDTVIMVLSTGPIAASQLSVANGSEVLVVGHRALALTASLNVNVQYARQFGSGTAVFSWRTLTATPVRVS